MVCNLNPFINPELFEKLCLTWPNSNNQMGFVDVFETNSKSKALLMILLKYLIKSTYDNSDVNMSCNLIVESNNFRFKETPIIKNCSKICPCLYNKELRHKMRETDPTINCVCGMFKYMATNKINYHSYSDKKIKGKYYFPDTNIVHQFILNNPYSSKYLFVEHKTPNFKFYLDLDFKHHKINNPAYSLVEYMPIDKIQLVIDHILLITNQLLEFINIDYNKFIYASKIKINDELADPNLAYGVHIYYPNYVVNKAMWTEIVTKITNRLISDNILNTPLDIIRKLYESIVDSHVKNNGLVLLYQEKDGYSYQINQIKSTYLIPSDKIKQLELCALSVDNYLT